MDPERKKMVDGHKVEEYYQNGELVVYIDNYATGKTFEEAVSDLQPKESPDER